MLPERQTIQPLRHSEREADEGAWRGAMSQIRRQAKAAGFQVKSRVGGSGPASWADAHCYLTREGGTAVEVFAISEADNSRAIVRQHDAASGHSGPNHSRGVTTVEEVARLAAVLSALPFERDRCAHCGADEFRRDANGAL